MPRPLAAVLSAALFLALNYYGQMAGEWVVGGVEAKCFAYGFVLMALRDMVDRRWGMVCLLLGAVDRIPSDRRRLERARMRDTLAFLRTSRTIIPIDAARNHRRLYLGS